MTDQPTYPYADGDVTVLGPEIFASLDGAVISWRGENYVRQEVAKHWERAADENGKLYSAAENQRDAAREAVAGLAQAIRLTREYVGAELLPAIDGWSWYDALRRWAPHELGDTAPPEATGGPRSAREASGGPAERRDGHSGAEVAPGGSAWPCSCGGSWPIRHLHADEHILLDAPNNAEQPARTTPDNPPTSSDTPDSPLRQQIAAVVRPWLLGADEADVEHCAAAVAAAILPTTRLLGALHQSAHDDITRVIALYERWVKAGPPPLGTSINRWWDGRLVELHDAIRPPQEQP